MMHGHCCSYVLCHRLLHCTRGAHLTFPDHGSLSVHMISVMTDRARGYITSRIILLDGKHDGENNFPRVTKELHSNHKFVWNIANELAIQQDAVLRKTVNILSAVSKNTLYLHYTESRATKSLKTLHVLVVSKIRVGFLPWQKLFVPGQWKKR